MMFLFQISDPLLYASGCQSVRVGYHRNVLSLSAFRAFNGSVKHTRCRDVFPNKATQEPDTSSYFTVLWMLVLSIFLLFLPTYVTQTKAALMYEMNPDDFILTQAFFPQLEINFPR